VYFERPNGTRICLRASSIVESYHSKAHHFFDASGYSPYLYNIKQLYFNHRWNIGIDVRDGNMEMYGTLDWRKLEQLKLLCISRGIADPLPGLRVVPLRTREQQAQDARDRMPMAAVEAFDAGQAYQALKAEAAAAPAVPVLSCLEDGGAHSCHTCTMQLPSSCMHKWCFLLLPVSLLLLLLLLLPCCCCCCC
jgi:hypothetical protein